MRKTEFTIPSNCGLCHYAKQIGELYICTSPVGKEKEMLDISAFKVSLDSLDSRPEWCPMKEIKDKIDNLSEKDRALLDKVLEGICAMRELMHDETERRPD